MAIPHEKERSLRVFQDMRYLGRKLTGYRIFGNVGYLNQIKQNIE